jgi:hypothetical protein
LQPKNGPESNHQCFLKVSLFEVAPSGTASLAISGDDATFHWRNDVDAKRLEPLQQNRPMLKSSNFLTITGKMILTRRDFDLKSSAIHQEIGKSKAKAHVR